MHYLGTNSFIDRALVSVLLQKGFLVAMPSIFWLLAIDFTTLFALRGA